MEWFRSPLASKFENGVPIIAGTALERDILDVVYSIRDAPIDGLAELPVFLSFALVSRNGFRMWGKDNYPLDIALSEQLLNPSPTIIYAWTDLDAAMKRFFDVLWQAFGVPASPNYARTGERIA